MQRVILVCLILLFSLSQGSALVFTLVKRGKNASAQLMNFEEPDEVEDNDCDDDQILNVSQRIDLMRSSLNLRVFADDIHDLLKQLYNTSPETPPPDVRFV